VGSTSCGVILRQLQRRCLPISQAPQLVLLRVCSGPLEPPETAEAQLVVVAALAGEQAGVALEQAQEQVVQEQVKAELR
jgi:hypothetical protein